MIQSDSFCLILLQSLIIIFLLQQVLPFGLLVVVMIYELTRHLLFQEAAHPSLLTIELLVFGITGPAALWLTLNWIRQEIRARETAQAENLVARVFRANLLRPDSGATFTGFLRDLFGRKKQL